MVAPIVAAAGNVAAKKLNEKFPGGLLALGAVSMAGVMLMSMMIINAISGIFGAGAGAAAAVAECADLNAGVLPVGNVPGIGPTALDAYQKAGAATGVPWYFIAGIGKIESSHGTYGGSSVNPSGDVKPEIIGIALDGTNGTTVINDTDNGKMDHDTVYDRAVGPMQFIPSTWAGVGKDGNFDGQKNPHNMYDAALATGFYLKNNGAPGNIRGAIFAYNHSDSYVDSVLAAAQQYELAGGTPTPQGPNGGGDVTTTPGISPASQVGPNAIRMGHANIYTGLPAAQFAADLNEVISYAPDFVTLNEINHRSKAQFTPRGYSSWQAQGDVWHRETPVLWRTDRWNLLDKGFKVMHRKPGDRWGLRVVNWVTLRDEQGRVISVISVHPSPHRAKLLIEFTKNLNALVLQLATKGAVLIGGDYNARYDDSPGQQPFPEQLLLKAGIQPIWDFLGPPDRTHDGGVVIDYIMFQRNNGLNPKRKQVFPMNSDHWGIIADFDLGVDTAGPGNGQPPGQPPVPNTTNTGSVSATGWTYPETPGTYHLSARFGQSGGMWSSGHHTGLDFNGDPQTDHVPIYAANSGTVRVRGDQSWAGPNLVIIDHGMIEGKHVETWYAHMSRLTVTNGATVTGGQQIGFEGALGNVTGQHLHFEVRVDGVSVDPETWLAGAGAPDVGGGDSAECGSGLFTGAVGVVTGTISTGSDGAWGGYQNGRIPLSALCPLGFEPSALLRCDAAAAMNQLNAAFRQRFGKNVGPVGGYRSYEAQVVCQQEKGSLCATPGTSNHGWGLAADLAAGINNFGTPEHKWMEANAAQFGWILPPWAQANGSKPEPWHWQFGLTD